MNRTIVKGCPSKMGDDVQLNTTTMIRHAARTHGDQQIVYRTPDGGWDRYTYADCYQRVCRAANALRKLGVGPGDRVGILDWNNRRHFELYWAIPGLAAVMLQMNLRLGPEDLGYVVQHSNASFIAVDESLLPVAESIASFAGGVKGWIVLTDKPISQIKTKLSPLYHYEDLLAAAEPSIDWAVIDERAAYSACYTTGTTGRPKGVYYSHRAIYLHSMTMATALGMTLDDCTMLITPMFHGQCWGLPQAATLMCNKIVLPGRRMDLFDRHGECDHVASLGRRGRGDRRAPSEMAGAPGRDRQCQAGSGVDRRSHPRASGTVICQMAVARGRDPHEERRTHQRRQS